MRIGPPALAILLSMLPAGIPAAAAGPAAPSLSRELHAAITSFPGTAAVIVVDPGRGYRFAHDGDRVFLAASLYKLWVMGEAYRRAAAGRLSFDDMAVTITDEDASEGGWSTPAGTSLTVRQAIERMVTVSDNSSSRALARLLEARSVSTTSARDLETFFQDLLAGTMVSAEASAEMLGILERQRVNDRLPTGVPEGTSVAHKTGNLDGVAHDAGIIVTPTGPRIVVMLCADFASYDDVTVLAARIAAAAYGLPADRLSGALTVAGQTQRTIEAGAAVTLTITVTNATPDAWDGDVALGSSWRVGDRRVRSDSARVRLPALPPGGSATVTVADRAPGEAGVWRLEWELLEEDVAGSDDVVAVLVRVERPLDEDGR